MDRINPDARENLPKVRQLILEGKIPEAEELLRTAFSGNPQSQHPYQKAGDVEIRHMGLWKDWGFGGPKSPEEYTEYKRMLDMEKGLAEVSFSQDGVDYEREYLASYPAQVLAMRLRASRPGSISIRLLLTRDRMAVRKPWKNWKRLYSGGESLCKGRRCPDSGRNPGGGQCR